MFHHIPDSIAQRMKWLEDLNDRLKQEGRSAAERLRQIPPDTGRFLALLACSAPVGKWLEIGTSAGYSTLWLALACTEVGATVTTFEILEEKAELARETFRLTGTNAVVNLVVGDAREHLSDCRDVAFCFLDAEKDVYRDCYELVVPNLVKGGILVADNAISHKTILQPMIDRVLADERVDAMVLPIDRGELVCRKR
ncbi:MAG: class I SAM-dependent methyltransferase [candidate division Zixibacteria bacterium]|nr:class I SAM-dependent methyltransferase [candidate division Zixibacteria bacterium]